MHVHEMLARHRNVEQLVALAGNLGEAAADHEDEVAVADELHELRIATQTDVADEAGVLCGEQHLAAELHGHRELPGLCEGLELGHRLRAPATAAQNRHGLASLRQALGNRSEERRVGY